MRPGKKQTSMLLLRRRRTSYRSSIRFRGSRSWPTTFCERVTDVEAMYAQGRRPSIPPKRLLKATIFGWGKTIGNFRKTRLSA